MGRRRNSLLSWVALSLLVRVEGLRAQEDLLALAIGDGNRRDTEISVGVDTVVDTHGGAAIAPAALYATLGSPRIVLVGEEHTDAAYHDVQLHVIEALHAAAIPLLIGLEMFPAASQPVLDRWVRGDIDEADFVEESEWYSVWGYHYGYYRAIFEFARANRVRLIGLNEASGKSVAVDVVDIATDDHRALVRAFFEVDSPVHGGISDVQLEQLTQAQARRDASMAQHAVRALDRNPLHTMIVLAGTGHVLYDLGIARQLPEAYRDASASIVPIPVDNDSRSVRASVADIVWGVPNSPFPLYPELGVVAIAADHGLDVIHVDDDSPAAIGGIRVGDRLTALNDSTLLQRSDLSRAMARIRWGDIVTARLVRDNTAIVIEVALRR